MNATNQYLVHLREALTYLYDPHYLHHSPLLSYFDLDRAPDPPSALRSTLLSAIESLQPGDTVPTQTRERRIYELLFYRYVQQFSQREVADQLGISVRHLRREQVIALEALGDKLRDRVQVQVPAAETRQPAAEDLPAKPLDDELAWLRESPPEKVTDLSQELPSVLRLAQPLARQHNVNLHLSLSDPLVEAAVHPVAVRQLVLSVLDSAIHCHPIRRIGITTHLRNIELVIHIRCTVQARQGAHAGVGNLATVQQLAQLCGCALRMTLSDTTFEADIRLPALGQLPVLVIDDNPDTLELYQRYVMGTRYRLIGLREPAQALRVAQEVAPHLIVIDIMMPQVDGWELMGQLLHHPCTGHIPILVCSIVAQEDLAISLGASGFISKPVTRQAFLSALEHHVRVAPTHLP